MYNHNLQRALKLSLDEDAEKHYQQPLRLYFSAYLRSHVEKLICKYLNFIFSSLFEQAYFKA